MTRRAARRFVKILHFAALRSGFSQIAPFIQPFTGFQGGSCFFNRAIIFAGPFFPD